MGQALRSMAAEGRPRAHPLRERQGPHRGAMRYALRATGADEDAIMEDYLRVNADHADLIAEEARTSTGA